MPFYDEMPFSFISAPPLYYSNVPVVLKGAPVMGWEVGGGGGR